MKKQFNARKSSEYPWMKEVHRDAHAQPFANLAKAWSRFFDDLKKDGAEANKPVFKKKGKSRDSFLRGQRQADDW
jgi:putative transposase